ncbi:MAG: hypothetical protein QF921_02065 [Pseudomonadales bacterium]|nr:hypothetical protein [Pseudomonadales bacterium]MDP6471814.1 hypothetical protein [Pseudomonadales bacterium]MDP6828772.1 hypothetical protein [Pseudomonadales bacterium]MDP6970295.1 hypothetical protein [Pseudomonadales bacterium]
MKRYLWALLAFGLFAMPCAFAEQAPEFSLHVLGTTSSAQRSEFPCLTTGEK